MKQAPVKAARCTLPGCAGVIPVGRLSCSACGQVHLTGPKTVNGRRDDGIQRLSEIEGEKIDRIVTGFADRNWGPADDPGLNVCGVTLLGGAPGAGKSTLCSQLLSKISHVTGGNTLYVGSEESGVEVKARVVRLGIDNLEKLLILSKEKQAQDYVITDSIFEDWKPRAWVIDSLQEYTETPHEAVDFCRRVKELTVKYRCHAFVICQVNKEEEFAGLQGQMHAVDTLVRFTLTEAIEGPDGRVHYPPTDAAQPGEKPQFRVLSTGKNRNGTSFESYFTMYANGLRPYSVGRK